MTPDSRRPSAASSASRNRSRTRFAHEAPRRGLFSLVGGWANGATRTRRGPTWATCGPGRPSDVSGWGSWGMYPTGLPNSTAIRISSCTPTLSCHPSSIRTSTSSHRSSSSRSYRCQNAQSVGRPCFTSGWLWATGEKTDRLARSSVAVARQASWNRCSRTAGSGCE